MKKKAAVFALLAVLVIGLSAPAAAHRYLRNADGNPLSLVRYGLHPIGIALEYGIFRPVHWLVSQPHLDIVFGHKAHPGEGPTYFEWKHGDYEPSIAYERSRDRVDRHAPDEVEARRPMKRANGVEANGTRRSN